MQPKKKERYNAKARQHKRGETPAVAAAIDSNADIIDTAALAEIKKAQEAEKNEPVPMSKKKRKRLEQYINRKLKKEERVDLIAQLATSSFDHSLLHSSAKLGRGVGKETKREKLKRALTEEKLGLTPSTDIYVSKPVPPQDDDDEDEDMVEATPAFPVRPVAPARPTVTTAPAEDGAALSDGESAVGAQPAKKRKKNKKQKAKKEPVPVEEFRRLDDSDSDMEPILIPKTASSKPKVYVVPNRDAAVQEGRLNLPVVQEEDRVMETLNSHSVTVLCGETGSGKTTQVPQFLYEAGYSHPDSDFPGWIGVTQPRRVAAVAMAERVGHELNTKDQVSYQIRFEKTTTPSTRIHFMTDGVLLKEVSSDLLLSKYSVMIVDEAHERNLNTDILIGVLSRVVKLRDQLHAEWLQKKVVADKLGQAFRDPRVTPLKLIIMSATLRVSDFTENARLFPVPPPVINVQARQFPVTVHFNRRTPRDHVFDAYRKVCKIHARLPAGGILVFMTGQNEIYDLITRLKRKYDPVERARIAQAKLDKMTKNAPKGKGKSKGKSAASAVSFDEDRTASLENRMAEVDEGLVNHARVSASVKSDERLTTQGATTVLVDETSANKGEGTTQGDEGDDEDEFELSDDDDDQDADLDEDYDPAQRDDFDEVEDEDHTDQPLHVLPLYSLLSTDQQMKVFDAVPEGHRLCVVATNVAETSLTIPGIRYVVDCGKAKEKVYDPATSIQSFVVSWTSKASADQRAGRAGRTGPGHCYRLYSSAVYDQQFQQFSLPEILRMPIDSVVLQLKAMNMDNVINFPFPTPPNRTDLAKAEKLLQSLGALDEQGHITLTGTKMSQFPIHPRFAKMLLLGMQQGLIEYAIAIVAALSVGEVFVSPDEAKRLLAERKRNKGGNADDADAQLDEDAMDVADDDAKDKDDDGSGAAGQLLKSVMDRFAGKPRTSDALFLLNLVGAFEYAGGSTKFCRTHLLRPKAMLEVRALRRQLTAMVQNVNSKLHVTMNPRMQPPNETQTILLRQLLLAGFVDQLAIPHPHPPLNDEDRPRHYMYQSMANDAICCIARNSVLAGARPSALVFTQLQQGTRNVWMKGVTAVDLAWVPVVGKDLCVFSKPLEMPAPTYDAKSDTLTCHVVPRIGPFSWELPTTKVPLTKPPAVHQWFARYLLEGKVFPGWAPLNAVWVTQPSAITKDTYRGQKRVLALVQDLMVKKVASKAQLLEVWKTYPAFLLDAVVQWVPPELTDAVHSQWPMTNGSFKP
ncbi:hypothetical protein AMAG_03283 [Allomyces macrogynus ATCC 38327]|uniref:RNA helicase n=1 Tax=Allomyces macrogynus (strain ATCC 38327) TaxID=578462 RepID=A0A0L0S4Y4_ALLM3|nr:hypothetical protein AMAG_03283 [Allomyces macrogynus ATCC 38327]|eukprot:KNE57593.1 hypothetical protein AMAG_03283 [Allomyces macrogynus ATCC 38327]